MVTRRRRQTNRPRRTNPARAIRSVNRSVTGFAITPTVDPPGFASGPWWPLTIIMSLSGDQQIVYSNLKDQLLAQLSWAPFVNAKSETLPIEIRVLTVRTWGMNSQPHQLTIYDHLGGKHRIKELIDYPSQMNRSRLGWRFGSLGTSDALNSGDTDVVFEVASSTGTVLVYVQVLFRTANAPKPAALCLPKMAPADDFTMLHVS